MTKIIPFKPIAKYKLEHERKVQIANRIIHIASYTIIDSEGDYKISIEDFMDNCEKLESIVNSEENKHMSRSYFIPKSKDEPNIAKNGNTPYMKDSRINPIARYSDEMAKHYDEYHTNLIRGMHPKLYKKIETKCDIKDKENKEGYKVERIQIYQVEVLDEKLLNELDKNNITYTTINKPISIPKIYLAENYTIIEDKFEEQKVSN